LEASQCGLTLQRWSALDDVKLAGYAGRMPSLGLSDEHQCYRLLWRLDPEQARLGNGFCHRFDVRYGLVVNYDLVTHMYLFFGCFVLGGISFVAIVAKLVKNIFLSQSEASIAASNAEQE